MFCLYSEAIDVSRYDWGELSAIRKLDQAHCRRYARLCSNSTEQDGLKMNQKLKRGLMDRRKYSKNRKEGKEEAWKSGQVLIVGFGAAGKAGGE